MPGGEVIPKNHKLLKAIGTTEELIGIIGQVKAKHFMYDLDDETNIRKMFIHSRLTCIQKDLLAIIQSMITTPGNPKFKESRFSENKLQELDNSTEGLNSSPYHDIPGSHVIEADLYMVWCKVRKCERDINSIPSGNINLSIDETVILYVNQLGRYFNLLITSVVSKLT